MSLPETRSLKTPEVDRHKKIPRMLALQQFKS